MNLLPLRALTARHHRSAPWIVRLFLSLLGLVAAASVSLAATILTDKADYAPAETALITGEGWLPGETVRLEIDHITGGGPFGDGHDPWEVVADESGKVTTTWFVNPDDSLGATFLMTADGLTSGRRAEWTFTDGRTIASVRLNGGTRVTVPPGSTITAVVTVNGFNGGGPSNWESTGWRVSATPPGTLTVVDHADRTGTGTWNETFTIRAPNQPGSYNAYFIAYANDTGSGGSAQPSALYTLAASVTVTSSLSLSESHVDVTCHGAGDGAIDLSVSGGTAPFSYLWSNGATTQDLSGLTPGIYSVTVTDASSLTASTSVTITQPPALVATSSATTIQCYGGTATVTVSATGGTAPYTGTGTFNVGAGTYSYTVTDAKGCTASTSITVIQPPALVAASSATTIQCYGGTATVTVSATGGTAPYTGAGTFTVGAGTYNYMVTDANGCTASTSITITQPPAFVATASATTILCHGDSATVTVSATGGTAPYTGTGTFTVGPGTYNYTVTDSTGCTASTSITVTQPAPLVATASATTIQCHGDSATVTVSATGGTGPYTGTGNFTVGPGTYSYTVTDANGCAASTSVTVTEPPPLVATSSATTIPCHGGSATVTVSATGGTAPYTGTGTFTVGAGTHSYTVRDAGGCAMTTSVTVSQPTPLVASSSATPILTPGGSSTVTVTATGGVAPYTGTGAFIVGAGTHSYTVTDANGCSSATTVTVTAPAQLIAFVSQNRTVASSASASDGTGGNEMEQSDAAVEFEPFLSLADSSIELPLETGLAFGQGAALQDSILGFAAINASGEASLSLSLPADPNAAAAANAQSYFDVSFALPNSGVVSFAGLVTTQVTASDGAAAPVAETQVRLIDSATSAVLAQTSTGNEEFSFAGPLNAGTYQIVALATVNGAQAGSTSLEHTVTAQSTYSFALEYAPEGEPGGGSGETYFVDYASGSDAADGLTIATAWKHVPGDAAATGVPAATVLARGDTIRFKGGVVYYGGFFVDHSGVAGDPIVYDGNHGGTWGSGRAILDGNHVNQPAITVSANVRHIAVLGFEIRNVGGYADDDPILSTTLVDGAVSSPPGGTAISVSKGGNVGIRLENLFIHRVGQWRNQEPFSGANSITGTGISVQNVDGITIKDCEFTKMRNPLSLKATTILQNVLVENCDLHEYFVWGIDVAPRASGAILRNIEIRNNIIRDYHQYDLGNWLGGGEKPHSDGMFLRTARIISTWDNIRVHGNLFYADDLGNSQGGTASIYLSQGPSALVYNNVFINDRHSRSIMVGGTAPSGMAKQVVRIMNNTLVRMSAIYSDDSLLDPSLKDLYITGNVIYRVSSVNNHVMVNRDSGVYFRELEGNCYFDPNYTVTQRYILIDRGYRKLNVSPSVRELGFEVYGDYADPKFVNGTGLPSLMNLRVQSDSPARFMAPNQSEFFTTDKDGNPRPATGRWTAGAFQ